MGLFTHQRHHGCFMASVLLLSGCASFSGTNSVGPPPPKQVENICAIFQQYPAWYQDALMTYRRWRVPVSVQMAIIKHESDFQAGARPIKRSFFGFTSIMTSAYGYAQALNSTWKEYQSDTHHYDSTRNTVGDSLDFIGWYANKAHQKAGIPLNDAYDLYLAYHEGIDGYLKGSYRNKPALIQVAKEVKWLSLNYKKQLHRCKHQIA